MTFVEIVNTVLADRFSEGKRSEAKLWVNYRYGRVWVMEPWSFKYQTTQETLAPGATTIPLASNLIGKIISITEAGTTGPVDMYPNRPEDFRMQTTPTAGQPYRWTVIGDNIVFDRPADISRTYDIISEIKFQPLVGDGNVPLIPEDFHLLLASGASAHGLRLENDPSWQGFEDDYGRAIEDMKHEYLTPVSTFGDSYPSWP